MVEHQVGAIYLDFFGTQPAIEWHKIPNQRVTAETAKQIQNGWLAVSVSNLMRPEWDWLRRSQRPVDKIGHTIFVYQLGQP
jgi:hypothetical protein